MLSLSVWCVYLLIYTTIPCKVMEYILRLGDPSIKIAISVTSCMMIMRSHEVESHEAMLAGDRSGRVGGGEQGRGRGL